VSLGYRVRVGPPPRAAESVVPPDTICCIVEDEG